MEKKVYLVFLLVAVLSAFVVAQDGSGFSEEDEGEILGDVLAEFESQEIDDIDPGFGAHIPVISAIDEFFDGFSDAEKVLPEKAAEILERLEAGDIEGARKALARYERQKERILEDADPARREVLRANAAAIEKAFSEFDFSEEEAEEFAVVVEDGLEESLTAVEISSKIKDLCESLAEIDPLEYSKVCRAGEDADDWQKRLDDDLTKKQREEAIEFGEIMSECFRTSGEKCRCEDISFTDFAEQCAIMAPLAYECDVNDNEEACEKLDELEQESNPFDLLPNYLQDVISSIEDDYDDARYDNYIPGPCREAGIDGTNEDDRQKCFEIIARQDAPEECHVLLDEGFTDERKFHDACEKLLFEIEAPPECLEEGIDDWDECGIFMFRQNAPEICLEHGLTGEHRSDMRKCEELAKEEYDDDLGPGPGFGFDCGSIENSEERLDCYDRAAAGVHERSENHRDFEEEFRECADRCLAEGRPFFMHDGGCECGEQPDFGEFEDNNENYFPSECIDAGYFDSESCEDYLKDLDGDQEGNREDFGENVDESLEEFEDKFNEEEKEEEVVDKDDSSEEVEEEIGNSITGGVISIDSEFFNYYFR